MEYQQIKQAAVDLDVSAVDAVYPVSFLERWGQLGMDMPKTAAERDTLIQAAYNVSKAKAAQYAAMGGVRPSSQIARVADMAKRAADDYGVGDYSYDIGNYDLSGPVSVLSRLVG
jgi:hypothetical protein